MAGYEFSGLLADAQFATKLSLRSLKLLGVPLLMRYRTNAKIIVGDKIMKVRELAERYPTRRVRTPSGGPQPWGSARWYSKLERYLKRLKVAIPKVGAVDLRTDSLDLIVWKRQSRGWQLTALVSTIEGGVQEVMRAWKSRWSLEVSHRIRTRSKNVLCGPNEADLVRLEQVFWLILVSGMGSHGNNHPPFYTCRSSSKRRN